MTRHAVIVRLGRNPERDAIRLAADEIPTRYSCEGSGGGKFAILLRQSESTA